MTSAIWSGLHCGAWGWVGFEGYSDLREEDDSLFHSPRFEGGVRRMKKIKARRVPATRKSKTTAKAGTINRNKSGKILSNVGRSECATLNKERCQDKVNW